MFLQTLVENANLFFLILVRVMALFTFLPVLSSDAIPAPARAGMAFFTSITVFPWVLEAGYPLPEEGLAYAALVLGEILLGIIQSFYLVIIFAIFQLSGQFFSVQMGFGASEVFDPMAQIQIPVLGQIFNLMAMFIFISFGGLHNFFLIQVYQSFRIARAWDLLTQVENVAQLYMQSLTQLFEHSFLLSLPILGTLILISVTLGLLAKAAPQMNLLMIGFPISITVGFVMIILTLPFMAEAFEAIIDGGNRSIAQWLDSLGALP